VTAEPDRAVLVAGHIRLVRVMAAPSARLPTFRFLATYGPIDRPDGPPVTWSSGWEADPNTALDHLASAIERWPSGPYPADGPPAPPPAGPSAPDQSALGPHPFVGSTVCGARIDAATVCGRPRSHPLHESRTDTPT